MRGRSESGVETVAVVRRGTAAALRGVRAEVCAELAQLRFRLACGEEDAGGEPADLDLLLAVAAEALVPFSQGRPGKRALPGGATSTFSLPAVCVCVCVCVCVYVCVCVCVNCRGV